MSSTYSGWLFPRARKIIKALAGPKYDGKYLHGLVREKLGDKKLNQTLTNVVIPAFDIKSLQPAIFSSFEVHPQFNFTFTYVETGEQKKLTAMIYLSEF